MRCKSCNRPFTPTLSYRANKPYFATTCSRCNSSNHQGYANSHEHVLGFEEEPLVMVAKTGSIKMQEY